ncbi:UNVERIFIED_CONTAM: hypothetical protein FKN15_053209 [Acipenser sinensis]
MSFKNIPLATVTIGPESWRDVTVNAIRLSDRLVKTLAPCRSGARNGSSSGSPVIQLREEPGNTAARDQQLGPHNSDLTQPHGKCTNGFEAESGMEKTGTGKYRPVSAPHHNLHVRDGADCLLEAERKLLIELKSELEIQLKMTRHQLEQHLQVSSGESRVAIQRVQRWYDENEHSEGRVLGYAALRQSLLNTSQDLGLLHRTRLQLEENMQGKRAAAGLDSAITRLRRRNSDHRWTVPHLK